jgi:serine/threonine-protein kinase
MSLLEADWYDDPPLDVLSAWGEVFAVFDERTQDSGNVSYGVRSGTTPYFVKSAGPEDVGRPLTFDERVSLLRNAVRISRAIASPLLPSLVAVIEGRHGPLLVYEWVEGEALYAPAAVRAKPDSALSRFRRLPPDIASSVVGRVIHLHSQLGLEGWVALDFYDGCLLHDFSSDDVRVVDLDHYQPGPFVNEVGRLPGSTRFMAPEKFRVGATVDHRTTVFNLGRLAFELLGDGQRTRASFRSSDDEYVVAIRATESDPARRFADPTALDSAWRFARGE